MPISPPVEAARHSHRSLAKGSAVMLVGPYADDRIENNLNPVGQLYYAASTTLCCAHAISENGSHALGAQAGFERLSGFLREAGFDKLRVAA